MPYKGGALLSCPLLRCPLGSYESKCRSNAAARGIHGCMLCKACSASRAAMSQRRLSMTTTAATGFSHFRPKDRSLQRVHCTQELHTTHPLRHRRVTASPAAPSPGGAARAACRYFPGRRARAGPPPRPVFQKRPCQHASKDGLSQPSTRASRRATAAAAPSPTW